jgi:hypothetical protein
VSYIPVKKSLAFSPGTPVALVSIQQSRLSNRQLSFLSSRCIIVLSATRTTVSQTEHTTVLSIQQLSNYCLNSLSDRLLPFPCPCHSLALFSRTLSCLSSVQEKTSFLLSATNPCIFCMYVWTHTTLRQIVCIFVCLIVP